jgi:hypothetical protein
VPALARPAAPAGSGENHRRRQLARRWQAERDLWEQERAQLTDEPVKRRGQTPSRSDPTS